MTSRIQQKTACSCGPEKEPYYLETGDETKLFEADYGARLPVMLKGPTNVIRSYGQSVIIKQFKKQEVKISSLQKML